jgi:GH25 family lysozyme M1 (1,4-beta-N-acetylmuramidase)
VIWQFSQTGAVDGITGNVDENHLNIPFADFRARFTL